MCVFNNVSLDGYFTDANNDYRWAHEGANDPELMAFSKSNAQGTSALVFGRVTYEVMAAWWPSPAAATAMPDISRGMNQAPKYVFSRTLDSADWSNTTLLRGDPAAEIERIKQTPGPDMTLLESGAIVAQLAAAGLIDESTTHGLPDHIGFRQQPVRGRDGQATWTLSGSKTFKNGRVFLAYARA